MRLRMLTMHKRHFGTFKIVEDHVQTRKVTGTYIEMAEACLYSGSALCFCAVHATLA
jgi:hypothetical protein